MLRGVGAVRVGSSPAAMRELRGSSLPFISLFTRAWRGKSLEAFMGIQVFPAALLRFALNSESLLTALDDVGPEEAAGVCLAPCPAGC